MSRVAADHSGAVVTAAADILDRIVARTRQTLPDLRAAARREDWHGQARAMPAPPDFAAALRTAAADDPCPVRVIAEVKKASPSAGVIRADFDPVRIAGQYAAGGAAALSVLTDEPFFQGSLESLRSIRAETGLPLLRKDFLLEPCQLAQARLAGAAAVLLIAECLTPSDLVELVACARSLHMTALVELHDAANLPAVLDSGAEVVGVNNRDLRTFATDIGHTVRLAADVPRDRILVSESGIRTTDDLRRLADRGVAAVLVGESLMRQDDPAAALRRLRGVS